MAGRRNGSGGEAAGGVRSTRAAEIRAALADAIISGELAPGTRLDEVELARRYAASRTPVREALRELAAVGLAAPGPGRSLFAASVTEERLSELFEVMAEMEALCAQMAARKMTPQERNDLYAMHTASAALVRDGAQDAYSTFNERFHTQIYAGGHNGVLVETTLQVRQRLAPFRRAQFRAEGRIGKSYEEHERIVVAILQADADEAARAMRFHISTVRAAFAVYSSARQPETQPAA